MAGLTQVVPLPERAATLADNFRKRFENMLSAEPIALIGWLAILSVAIVLLVALVVALLQKLHRSPI